MHSFLRSELFPSVPFVNISVELVYSEGVICDDGIDFGVLGVVQGDILTIEMEGGLTFTNEEQISVIGINLFL